MEKNEKSHHQLRINNKCSKLHPCIHTDLVGTCMYTGGPFFPLHSSMQTIVICYNLLRDSSAPSSLYSVISASFFFSKSNSKHFWACSCCIIRSNGRVISLYICWHIQWKCSITVRSSDMEEILEVSYMKETEECNWQKRGVTGMQHHHCYQYDHTVRKMRCIRHA